jgi:hypothetical protein
MVYASVHQLENGKYMWSGHQKPKANLCLRIMFLSTLFFSGQAFSEDNWYKTEQNLRIKQNNFGLEVRTYAGDDYDHIELQYKFSKDFAGAFRLAEDGGINEYRPRLTHTAARFGVFTFSQRIEYRYFEGNADDFWRYFFIMDAQSGDAWLKFMPRWKFGGGNRNDEKIDEVRYQAGYNFAIDEHLQFTPHLDYFTVGEKDSWHKTHLIAGLSLEVRY